MSGAVWLLTMMLFLRAGPRPGGAQIVQGRLRDATSGTPVKGVLVLLLDTSGARQGGALSGEDGVFRIRAPRLGRYSVRAERIGFETIDSGPFDVGAGPGSGLTLALTPKALALEGIRVEAGRRCSVGAEEGPIVAGLWDEARKALRNQQWTDSLGVVRFRVDTYERNLDPGTGLVTAETRQSTSWVGRNPIRSLPVDDLLEGGFIRSDGKGGYRYYGPDAAVLLSDAFVETHCFGLQESSSDPDVVGLTFEPLRSRRASADIEGTLWLGLADARLRTLEFDYTWSPWVEAEKVANGRVEFEELPEGAWIVRNWWIRMPRMTQAFELMYGGRSGLRVAGLVEAGGTATRVDVIGVVRAAEAGFGRIGGLVWDSTRARPLAGAEVSVADGDRSTISDPVGRFALDSVPAGPQEVSFRHPRLDSLPVLPRVAEVTVTRGATVEVTLAVPSMATILAALCGAEDRAPGSGAVIGTVRSAGTREPVAGATVALEWTDYRVAGGRDLLADVQSRRVTTDDQGRYAVCGVPQGVLVAAYSAVGDESSAVRRAEVPREDVLVLDLDLGPAGTLGQSVLQGCPTTSGSDTLGSVFGQVREQATDVPVGRSLVWPASEERGTSSSVQSDAVGGPASGRGDTDVGEGGLVLVLRRAGGLGDGHPRVRTVSRTTDLLVDQHVTVLENDNAIYFSRTLCAPRVYIDGMRVTHLSQGKRLFGGAARPDPRPR